MSIRTIIMLAKDMYKLDAELQKPPGERNYVTINQKLASLQAFTSNPKHDMILLQACNLKSEKVMRYMESAADPDNMMSPLFLVWTFGRLQFGNEIEKESVALAYISILTQLWYFFSRVTCNAHEFVEPLATRIRENTAPYFVHVLPCKNNESSALLLPMFGASCKRVGGKYSCGRSFLPKQISSGRYQLVIGSTVSTENNSQDDDLLRYVTSSNEESDHASNEESESGWSSDEGDHSSNVVTARSVLTRATNATKTTKATRAKRSKKGR